MGLTNTGGMDDAFIGEINRLIAENQDEIDTMPHVVRESLEVVNAES